MTAVCWDGNTLAADTLYTAGGRKMQGSYEKIVFPEDKLWTIEGKKVLVFGFAGAVGSLPKIKEVLEAGVTGATNPDTFDDSFNLLIVTENKEVYNWTYGYSAQKEKINDLYITNGNFSVGSGGVYGLGVMAIKGNAIDAVKAAMKVDTHTGGYIDAWSFDKPTELIRFNPTTGEIVQSKQIAVPTKKKK